MMRADAGHDEREALHETANRDVMRCDVGGQGTAVWKRRQSLQEIVRNGSAMAQTLKPEKSQGNAKREKSGCGRQRPTT